MSFHVDTDYFRGPIDLLLFLVRRHELDVSDVALAGITQRYLDYLDVLKEISIDSVGDFLEVASMLVEYKARNVLPRNEQESEELEMADPREGLVARLLMYKQFRDAAQQLQDHSVAWQSRYSRMADDAPRDRPELADQPLHEVELWDLVSAFARIVRDNEAVQPAAIRYDDTPIDVYMEQIRERLANEPRLAFTSLFEPGMIKSQMVGIFLAVLELIRHHHVQVEQEDLFGELWILAEQTAQIRIQD